MLFVYINGIIQPSVFANGRFSTGKVCADKYIGAALTLLKPKGVSPKILNIQVIEHTVVDGHLEVSRYEWDHAHQVERLVEYDCWVYPLVQTRD